MRISRKRSSWTLQLADDPRRQCLEIRKQADLAIVLGMSGLIRMIETTHQECDAMAQRMDSLRKRSRFLHRQTEPARASVNVERATACPLLRSDKESHSAISIELLMTGRALTSAKVGPVPEYSPLRT